jgi:hypothetical protein
MRGARGRRRRRRRDLEREREREGDLRREGGGSSSSPAEADVRGKTAKGFSFPVMRLHSLLGSAVLDMLIRSPIHVTAPARCHCYSRVFVLPHIGICYFYNFGLY